MKAEWFNPGGSVKDRPVFSIIKEGERKGFLKGGKTILDATSGNAGISYSLIGAVSGYPVELCIPSNASVERRKVLNALGARLIFTNPLEGSDGAIQKARELYRANPKKYFYGNQYDNEENWKAHYLTTAPEIIEQTDGKITHFVTGVGTSGTLIGVGKRLRKFNSGIQMIEVQPSTPLHGLEGLKHMDSSIRPRIYDPNFADQKIEVDTEEAQEMVIKLASMEGLLVGTSGGANLVAALRVAKKLKEGIIVTILPDGAERYFSETYWKKHLENNLRKT
jgi:cysteine synthase B